MQHSPFYGLNSDKFGPLFAANQPTPRTSPIRAKTSPPRARAGWFPRHTCGGGSPSSRHICPGGDETSIVTSSRRHQALDTTSYCLPAVDQPDWERATAPPPAAATDQIRCATAAIAFTAVIVSAGRLRRCRARPSPTVATDAKTAATPNDIASKGRRSSMHLHADNRIGVGNASSYPSYAVVVRAQGPSPQAARTPTPARSGDIYYERMSCPAPVAWPRKSWAADLLSSLTVWAASAAVDFTDSVA